MRKFTLVFMSLALVAAVGCGKKDEKKDDNKKPAPAKTAPAKPDPAKTAPAKPEPAKSAQGPAAEAAALYKTVCSTCHGLTGKGDGAAAKALNPKPRDFSDPAWQKSKKDADLANVILKGGSVMTPPNPTMPPNPMLKDKPEVINELVKIVRGMAAK